MTWLKNEASFEKTKPIHDISDLVNLPVTGSNNHDETWQPCVREKRFGAMGCRKRNWMEKSLPKTWRGNVNCMSLAEFYQSENVAYKSVYKIKPALYFYLRLSFRGPSLFPPLVNLRIVSNSKMYLLMPTEVLSALHWQLCMHVTSKLCLIRMKVVP